MVFYDPVVGRDLVGVWVLLWDNYFTEFAWLPSQLCMTLLLHIKLNSTMLFLECSLWVKIFRNCILCKRFQSWRPVRPLKIISSFSGYLIYFIFALLHGVYQAVPLIIFSVVVLFIIFYELISPKIKKNLATAIRKKDFSEPNLKQFKRYEIIVAKLSPIMNIAYDFT